MAYRKRVEGDYYMYTHLHVLCDKVNFQRLVDHRMTNVTVYLSTVSYLSSKSLCDLNVTHHYIGRVAY